MRNCEMVSNPSSPVGGEIYGGKDLWKRNVLSLEWKSDGVMDGESGDDEGDGMTCERGESGRGRGWRNESGSMTLRDERVGGWARVTTDEERVLRGGWRDKNILVGRLVCIEFVREKENLMLIYFSQWRDLRSIAT